MVVIIIIMIVIVIIIIIIIMIMVVIIIIIIYLYSRAMLCRVCLVQGLHKGTCMQYEGATEAVQRYKQQGTLVHMMWCVGAINRVH